MKQRSQYQEINAVSAKRQRILVRTALAALFIRSHLPKTRSPALGRASVLLCD
jgi:hypothetical protein